MEKKMWQRKKKGDHAWPPRTMWEKHINSSRQPCDREPHFVMVAQSLSDWFLRRAHTHTHTYAKHRSMFKSCLKGKIVFQVSHISRTKN